MGAQIGPIFPTGFDCNVISLDIPTEGITTRGWDIQPMTNPMVSTDC